MDKHLQCIIKIQALWRGYKTRLWLEETRKNYESIFYDIQGNFNTDIEVIWPTNNICLPRFRDPYIPEKIPVGSKEGMLINRFSNDLNNSSHNGHVNNAESSLLPPSNENESNSSTAANSLNNNLQFQQFVDGSVHIQSSEKNGEFSATNPNFFLQCLENSNTHGDRSSSVMVEETASNGNDCSFTQKSEDIQNISSANRFAIDDIVVAESLGIGSNSGIDMQCTGNQHRDKLLGDSWFTEKSLSVNGVEDDLENKTEEELLKLKENFSMELLWIAQAIQSRKAYLHMKSGM